MIPSITIRVRALVVKDDHLLLARLNARPVAFLPGGRVEANESLESAIHRELHEETGVLPDGVDYRGAIEHYWEESGHPIHDLTHFFVGYSSKWSVATTPICNDEGVTMLWVPLSTLAQIPIQPAIQKKFIENYLAGDEKPWWATVRDV